MIIYKGSVEEFQQETGYGEIADKLEDLFASHHLPHNSKSERAAWNNSLAALSGVLTLAKIPLDARVLVEYQIRLTAKRVDFILSGFDEKGHDNVIIVELKQWDDCEPTSKDSLVMAFTGGALRLVAHPSYQAASYAETIENFNEDIRKKGVLLIPCAFCHNFEEKNRLHLDSSFYSKITAESPIFLQHDREKLANFISSYIRKSDEGKALVEIEYGVIKPSKALQDVVGSMIKGNEEFILLDEQKVCFESAMEKIIDSIKDGKKRTLIVKGGPGTGKSVVAINLLARTIKNGLLSFYVSKTSAPRNVYFEELRRQKEKAGYVKSLFKCSGSFMPSEENEFDVLIVDEAHRLNEKSGFYGTDGINQIKEIIHAARTSIFFLDEGQMVTLKDIGTAAEIGKWAKEENSLVFEGDDYTLTSEYRCNGSDAYLAFLDEALEIKASQIKGIEGLDFDFEVFDDPVALREALKAKNSNNKARMVAGYCYDWRSKKDPSALDIVLPNGFSAQWNFNSTATWAIDQDSFEQVGCIHTSQGLEFDYVGVIIGKDLRYENGKVIADYKARSHNDKSLVGLGKLNDKSIAETIIRNTYKVLLTRGQKGCYLYCEDRALSEHFKKLWNE